MGEDVKEFETRLSHWERVSKEYRLEIYLEKTVKLNLPTKRGRNTVLKIQ
jgi:hypothetical protein